MRISSIFVAAAIFAGVLGPLASAPAMALDVTKMQAEEKASRPNFWLRFFSARKQGQEQEAVNTLEYAAEQGDHAAQWKLGKMYQTGDGVEKDPAAAIRYYSQIVDNYSDAHPGSADWQFAGNALVALGRYHRDGVPDAELEADAGEALIMFTTAATYFDHPEAQYELARMYLDGENPQGDIIQAARMLKSASASGHVGAQALLGNLLFEGLHLHRDPVRGLSMMMAAKNNAAAEDISWIATMQEEAFALASEDERRQAVLMTSQQPTQ